MKKTMIILISLLQLMIGHAQTIKKNRPNIILFLVDDMGWMDSSQPFGDSVMALNRKFHTPNMERLARQGMLFSNAYANPVCTPTRTSLLTGASAARTHITNWTTAIAGEGSDYPDSILQTPAWNSSGISTSQATYTYYIAKPLPQLLQDAGYTTIHIGKAHWGSLGRPGSNPLNLGFFTNIGGSQAGSPQSYYGEQNFGNLPGKTSYNAIAGLYDYYGQDIFLTEALTLKAKQVLQTSIDHQQPFFLYMGQYAVHIPIQPDKRFVNRYLQAGLDSIEAAYASLVEGMDKSLGDIMDLLQEKKADKNTIIIFMSDNGGLSNHARGGGRDIQNLPLRAGKGSVYEGGIRVPMIVKWPGITQAGSKSDQYVIAEDFFPTVLEMAGIKDTAKDMLRDGISYAPILKNAAFTDSNRVLIFHYPHRWVKSEENAISWSSAIRKGNWKLVYLMKQKKIELYDLKDDIGERHDLAAVYPEKTAMLAARLGMELRRRGAQMPVWKKTGQPVAWPDELDK